MGGYSLWGINSTDRIDSCPIKQLNHLSINSTTPVEIIFYITTKLHDLLEHHKNHSMFILLSPLNYSQVQSLFDQGHRAMKHISNVPIIHWPKYSWYFDPHKQNSHLTTIQHNFENLKRTKDSTSFLFYLLWNTTYNLLCPYFHPHNFQIF